MKPENIIKFILFEIKKTIFSIGFLSSIILIVLSSLIWVFSQKIAPQIIGGSGYDFVFSSLRFDVNFLFPFLSLIISSVSINYDASMGIIATLTSGYMKREELLIGKYALIIVLFVMIFLTALIFNIVLGGIIWGFPEITEEGITTLSLSLFLPKLVLSSLLPVFSIIALISLGILFSILFRNIIGSISVSIGSFLLLDIIKGFFKYKSFLPTYANDLPFKELNKVIENNLLEFNINYLEIVLIPLIWAFLIFLISYFKIKKMDFHV